MRKIIKILSLFFFILWLLSWLSIYVVTHFYWPLGFLSLFYPVFILLSFGFLLLWIFYEWRIIFLLIIQLGLSIDFFQSVGFRAFFASQIDEFSRKQFRILTHNVDLFEFYKKGRFDLKPWISTYKHFDPTFLFLQECYLPDTNFLFVRTHLLEPLGLPHFVFVSYARVFQKGYIGFFTASKYPIVFHEKIRNITYSGKKIIGLRTDIVLPQVDTISFINLHLQSYQFNDQERNVLDVHAYDRKSMWNMSIDFLSKFRSNAISRSEQVEYLLNYISAIKHPVFLVGDFNELPWSYVYRRMSLTFEDAFVQKGSFTKFKTLNFVVPLRIDYIFYPVNKGWKVISYDVSSIRLNDHLPVVCTFVKE